MPLAPRVPDAEFAAAMPNADGAHCTYLLLNERRIAPIQSR